MRIIRLLVLAAGMSWVCAAHASIVTLTFSGAYTSNAPAGSGFSGTLTFDTAQAPSDVVVDQGVTTAEYSSGISFSDLIGVPTMSASSGAAFVAVVPADSADPGGYTFAQDVYSLIFTASPGVVTDTALPSGATLASLSATFFVNAGEFMTYGPATIALATTDVPEPPGWAVLVCGLGAIGVMRRRPAGR